MFGYFGSLASAALLMPLMFSSAVMAGNAADVTALGAKGGGIADDTAAIRRAANIGRRRQARAEIEAGGAQAAERWLKDGDAGIRKFALFSLYETDRRKGLAAARAMLDDANNGVKALARELTRDRRRTKSAPAELPLSQNPANDHEAIRVKSIACEGESFTMPPKMECDEVEVWFGLVKEHLMVWINDVIAGEWDPVRDAGREFRIDATKVVRWGAENKVWVTDERGKDRWLKFSVEIIKCGN